MKQNVMLDTGPLVAIIDRRDRFHKWTTNWLRQIEPPLLTCEAAITEACFLLRGVYGGEAAVISLINRRVVEIAFRLGEEAEFHLQKARLRQSVNPADQL